MVTPELAKECREIWERAYLQKFADPYEEITLKEAQKIINILQPKEKKQGF